MLFALHYLYVVQPSIVGNMDSWLALYLGGIFGERDMGRNDYVQGVYPGGSGFCAELKR